MPKATLAAGQSREGTIASRQPSSTVDKWITVGVMNARICGSFFSVRKLLPIEATTNIAPINVAAPVPDIEIVPGVKRLDRRHRHLHSPGDELERHTLRDTPGPRSADAARRQGVLRPYPRLFLIATPRGGR